MKKLLSGLGILLIFILAHLSGDYFLRIHEYLHLDPGISGYLLHSTTWAGIISVFLFFFKKFAMCKLVFLTITHLLIDVSKHNFFPSGLTVNIIDQILHLATIYVAYRFDFVFKKDALDREI